MGYCAVAASRRARAEKKAGGMIFWLKTVQGRLGHADVSLTLNTYTHVIRAKDREAANTLWGLLSGNDVEA